MLIKINAADDQVCYSVNGGPIELRILENPRQNAMEGNLPRNGCSPCICLTYATTRIPDVDIASLPKPILLNLHAVGRDR
eukprot:6294335-Amphidinium_carterae.1